MVQTVEISLQIPSLRVRQEGKDEPEMISNGDVRFRKRMELDSIPKIGTVLTVEVASGLSFQCEVSRSDWRDDKNLFVVACRYAKRSISAADYQTLMNAPDWEMQPLIP
jgi:hypothetical protein